MPRCAQELHRYLGGILKNLDCQPIIVGGVEDHVHLLASLSRTCTAAEMVKEVKRGSSLWVKEREAGMARLRLAERLRHVLPWLLAN